MEKEKKLICKTKDEVKDKPYGAWYSGEECWLEERQGVTLLRFCACQGLGWVGLAFSTRYGGISKGFLAEMNLGWDRGEPRENVCENYRRVCAALGVDYKRLVLSDQVHGKNVCYVDASHCGGEDIVKKLKGVDGLVTNVPGIVLATSFADCVPLFFIDTRTHWIASAHSGWRGTVEKIGQAAVNAMAARGSRPEDIVAIIGPSICQDCYEVSGDVAEEFRRAYGELCCRDILKEGRVAGQGEQKYQLDLWAANWHQLAQAGILPENIHVSGICTCCCHELFYSHRFTKGNRGNLNGFLYLRNCM